VRASPFVKRSRQLAPGFASDLRKLSMNHAVLSCGAGLAKVDFAARPHMSAAEANHLKF